MNAAVKPLLAPDHAGGFMRAEFLASTEEGLLRVHAPGVGEVLCEVLLGSLDAAAMQPGATLLVAMPQDGGLGVVMGQVGRLRPQAPPKHLILQATEAISLRCGEGAVELRADGKVLVKGEDVTVHAKGTQRIRAGTVAIN